MGAAEAEKTGPEGGRPPRLRAERGNNADANGLFSWANVEMQNFSLLRSSSDS